MFNIRKGISSMWSTAFLLPIKQLHSSLFLKVFIQVFRVWLNLNFIGKGWDCKLKLVKDLDALKLDLRFHVQNCYSKILNLLILWLRAILKYLGAFLISLNICLWLYREEFQHCLSPNRLQWLHDTPLQFFQARLLHLFNIDKVLLLRKYSTRDFVSGEGMGWHFHGTNYCVDYLPGK